MLKRCLPAYFTVSIFLIIFLFTTFNVVEAVPDSSKVSESGPVDTPSQQSERAPVAVPADSVLRLIPEKVLGVIYCPSLLELDNRINIIATELSPQTEVPDVSMQILKAIFGDEFESLADFEETGLDLNQDFAVCIASLQPLHLFAFGHLRDPSAMKQMIEAKGGTPTEYKGVTYWNTTEGNQSFAILENTFVFSMPMGVCENVIDTYNREGQGIMQNPNYATFLTDILGGDNQVGVCVDVEAIIATFDGLPEEELASIVNALQDGDPISKSIASFLEEIPGEEIGTLSSYDQ